MEHRTIIEQVLESQQVLQKTEIELLEWLQNARGKHDIIYDDLKFKQTQLDYIYKFLKGKYSDFHPP